MGRRATGRATVGRLVLMRVADLLRAETAWPQRLWRLGSIGHLEYCLSLADANSTETRKAVALGGARRALEANPVLDGKLRGQVLGALPKAEKLTRQSHSYFVLSEATKSLRGDAWRLWEERIAALDASAIPTSTMDLDVDVLAQALASHMRDFGLSDRWIVNSSMYHLNDHGGPDCLSAMLIAAAKVVSRGPGECAYLVPLDRRGRFDHETGRPWLSKAKFAAEFAARFPDLEVPEHTGGLVLETVALDKYGADEHAARLLRQALERVAIANGKRQLVVRGQTWVAPGGRVVDLLDAGARSLSLRALDGDGGRRLLGPLSGEVEAALDLLVQASKGSLRSGAVTGWAVLETLFGDASDYGSIAELSDRAAALLTCELVRDVFLSIASGHQRGSDDRLADSLRTSSPAEKMALVEDAVVNGVPLAVGDGLGLVTVQRARKLAVSPRELLNVRDELSQALRRLYEARNQVVHGVQAEPYALNLIVRSGTVLASGLVDSAIAAWLDRSEPAGMLVARATWALDQVSGGWPLSTVLLTEAG